MLEGLDDDNPELFKGGTLEITQEAARDNGLEQSNPPEIRTAESRTRIWNGLNPLIALPKKISNTLWNCNTAQCSGSAIPDGSETVLQVGSIVDKESPNKFFTFRDGVVERAVRECIDSLIDPSTDGTVLGTFLITEISLWDAEKERLVIVTAHCIVSIKYDFIALKQLEHKKISLDCLDSIVTGDLVYPPASLVPRLSGFANGVSDVMRGCLLEKKCSTGGRRSFVKLESIFQPRNRNSRGVRLLWNKGEPVAFKQKWNPFNSEVPFFTFTSHPLYYHTECLDDVQRAVFGVDEFSRCLIQAIDANEISAGRQDTKSCVIHHREIVLQTYVGLGSIIHNRNALGFFKVRGKFSF